MKRFAPVGWGALGFLIGMLPIFWLGGRALFFAGPLATHLGEVALAGVGLFALSVGGGAIAPPHRLAIAVGLALPVLPVLVLTSWSEPWAVPLALALTVLVAAASWGGTAIGVRVTHAVEARRAAK